MRVLVLVDHAVGISGPHRNVVGTLNALSAREDVDLRVLTGKIDASEPYAARCEIRLGFEPHQPRQAWKNIRLLRDAISDRDVVYVPTGLKSFLYGFAVKGKRKLVAGPNVTPLPLPGRHDSPGQLELRLMADVWFEASRSRRDHVVSETGNLKVRYVYHAIDAAKFNPDLRDTSVWENYNIPADTLKVLYVGHDRAPLKGVSCLLDAIAIINKTRNNLSKLSFIFCGSLSCHTLERIQRIENAYHLGFLTGEQLPRVYASSDISIVPSSWENFPFTVLEAMASGLPVIAARVGGIPEQVTDRETGILLDLAEPSPQGHRHRSDASVLLAEAVIMLASDKQYRRLLGQQARKRVLDHFTEKRLGDDLVELFTCLLSEAPK